MMFGLSLRVFFHFNIGFVLVLIIPATLSDTEVIQTEVGSRDKINYPNLSCQEASRKRLCESFGAQEVVHDERNCSCSCTQDANTFGFDGKYCKCLSNSTSYGGCPKYSQIDQTILQRNSRTKLLLPSKNCSLKVLYRKNNGSWITVKNITGIMEFSSGGPLNGSSVYVLKISNSINDSQGTLYNVIVQCPKQNGTCFLLKVSRKVTCPIMPLQSSTRAPTSPMTNVTTPTANSNNNSKVLTKGEMAAIIVSCVIFLAIILLVLFLCIRRRRVQAIKNNRRESRQPMTGDEDVEKRSSEPPVVYSRPNHTNASTQRKDSANLGFEPDAGNTSDDNDEDPDYDLPIDEKHSIISDFINKIKRPLSVKMSTPKQNEKEEKQDNEGDEYQIMEKLENPDNLENAAVYENTINGFVKGEPQPEAKQPSYKKRWRPKLRKKDKKPGGQSTGEKEGKSKDGDVPQLTVTEDEIPKKEGGNNMELENFYENNEIIKNNLRHEGPSRIPLHENRASYSNDVPEEEEGPPPPPRSTSLEKVLDKPSDYRPIPSPRMKKKLPNSQGNDDFNYKIDNQTENDTSELYENTRKSSNPKPVPRAKR